MTNKIYKGIITEQSLENTKILKSTQILATDPDELGTLHTVLISRQQIDALPEYFKEGPWYAHFWHGSTILVVFKHETFLIHSTNQKEWDAAIAYGQSIGIEKEALAFPID